MAEKSGGVISQILGEQEVPTAVSPILRHRNKAIRVVDVGETGPSELGISDASTLVKGMLPIYCKRSSSLLDLPENFDAYTRKKRVQFEIGDEDTPPWGRVDMGGLGSGVGRSVLKTGSLGLSEIESLARGLAGQANVPTIDAALQGIPRELSHECQWASEAGMGIQRSSYYPSLSAKTPLKEFFELNRPNHLDPTHQAMSLSSGQMIQFARVVGLKVALASIGLLDHLLVKSGIGNLKV